MTFHRHLVFGVQKLATLTSLYSTESTDSSFCGEMPPTPPPFMQRTKDEGLMKDDVYRGPSLHGNRPNDLCFITAHLYLA